jgi:hypothetical protein
MRTTVEKVVMVVAVTLALAVVGLCTVLSSFTAW